MNIFQQILEKIFGWVIPTNSNPICAEPLTLHRMTTFDRFNQRQIDSHWENHLKKLREDKILKINEGIKNLQLAIAIAKKQKKKHSHLLHEMAVLKAEVLRMEVM